MGKGARIVLQLKFQKNRRKTKFEKELRGSGCLLAFPTQHFILTAKAKQLDVPLN